MPRIARSAKGLKVDFDVLRIKQQIASAPKSTVVKAREDFVDQKFKRRLKRLTREVVEQSKDPKLDPKLDAKVEPIDEIPEKPPVKKKLKNPEKTSKE